jgi:hypothetical protein
MRRSTVLSLPPQLVFPGQSISCEEDMFHSTDTCGLYYKHIMILNDDSSVVSKRCSKLWRHLLTMLELSFTIIICL